MFKVVTVDLDDTLIETGNDYDKSAEEFGSFMSSEYDINKEEAIEELNRIDYILLEERGVQMNRYPESFERALKKLVSDPPESHVEHVLDIGFSTFKSEEEYEERGFIDGAKQMLDDLEQHAEELHLVTIGDEKAQLPKIRALNLSSWFDDMHIASYDKGKTQVFEDIIKETDITQDNFIHVGNSASSDVESAIEIGGYAVYISEDIDWLSNREEHEEYLNHDQVYAYETPSDFVSDTEIIVNTPQTR